jgi:hypothetical protein
LEAYSPWKIDEHVLGWQESCPEGFSYHKYPTGEDPKEALWRTLRWNIDFNWQYPASDEEGTSFEE